MAKQGIIYGIVLTSFFGVIGVVFYLFSKKDAKNDQQKTEKAPSKQGDFQESFKDSDYKEQASVIVENVIVSAFDDSVTAILNQNNCNEDGTSDVHMPSPVLASSVPTSSVRIVSEKDDGKFTPQDIGTTLTNLNTNNVTLRDAQVLNYALTIYSGNALINVLDVINKAAAFSANIPIFSKSGCLKTLLSRLNSATQPSSGMTSSVKLRLVRALVNLACNEENQQTMQSAIEDIFLICEDDEESDLGLACLSLVGNLSLTSACHPQIAAYTPRLYTLLEEEDAPLLKQVLIILVNLSCETATRPALLAAQPPNDLVSMVAGSGSFSVDSGLLEKLFRFLKNLFKELKESSWTEDQLPEKGRAPKGETMLTNLQEQRLQFKTKVFPLTVRNNKPDLLEEARDLLSYLQPPA